jgi:cell cycle checkpoint protein
VDARHILPLDLLQGPYVTRIEWVKSQTSIPQFELNCFHSFNPIAVTSMRNALRWVVDLRFQDNAKEKPSKELIEKVVETSGGDIRSALMTLQFTCSIPQRGTNKKAKKDTMAWVVWLYYTTDLIYAKASGRHQAGAKLGLISPSGQGAI